VHLELSNNQDKKQASCIHYRRKWKVWKVNVLFWLDFFSIEINHIPTKTPHEKYFVILWKWKCNYYKDVPILLGEKMNRKQEATTSASMSKHLCKDITRVIMLEELNKIISTLVSTCCKLVEELWGRWIGATCQLGAF
jgi:hypothetical protein